MQFYTPSDFPVDPFLNSSHGFLEPPSSNESVEKRETTAEAEPESESDPPQTEAAQEEPEPEGEEEESGKENVPGPSRDPSPPQAELRQSAKPGVFNTRPKTPILMRNQLMKHPKLTVTLSNSAVWHQFDGLLNEMTTCNKGTHMCPPLQYTIANLAPHAFYVITIYLKCQSASPFKYIERNAQREWQRQLMSIGGPMITNEVIVMKKCGEAMMRDGIRVDTKLFNVPLLHNRPAKMLTAEEIKECEKTMLHVRSQFKYVPVVSIYRQFDNRFAKVQSVCFTETEFIAVCSYRNPAVKALKMELMKNSRSEYNKRRFPVAVLKAPPAPLIRRRPQPSPLIDLGDLFGFLDNCDYGPGPLDLNDVTFKNSIKCALQYKAPKAKGPLVPVCGRRLNWTDFVYVESSEPSLESSGAVVRTDEESPEMIELSLDPCENTPPEPCKKL
ncbi:unnamed protein product [Caenorhabditis sp. 36 PRJEB53466]|nr:unnamed protein product [Caenorhabditis sp. 36 PRJEB53466]